MPKCNGANSRPKPWERQPGEGEKPFAAFVVYRDMEEKRSLKAVADELHKSYTLIRRWNDNWNWQERARAFDNDLQKQQYAEAKKASRKMATRHIDIALQMQVKALQALKNLDPEKLDPKTLIVLIREATSLERANRAELEKICGGVEQEGRAGDSLAEFIAAAWEMRQNNDNN